MEGTERTAGAGAARDGALQPHPAPNRAAWGAGTLLLSPPVPAPRPSSIPAMDPPLKSPSSSPGTLLMSPPVPAPGLSS